MKLTILGSGTYQPELERHSSSYLVETDNGQKICFDFGRGAIEQLLKLGIQITEIDALFLTHWHGDHVGDLIPLLHYTTAPLPDEVSLLRSVRTKPLKIYGPIGTAENIKKIISVIRYGKDAFANLEIKDIAEEKVKGDGWVAESFFTPHKPNALCFRFKEGNKILAYSGDTLECDGLRKAIKNADLAIIEASWPEEVAPGTHLTGQKAGKIAQEENAKKLILTHVSPLYMEKFNPKKDAKKFFKGEVIVAKDLMAFDISA